MCVRGGIFPDDFGFFDAFFAGAGSEDFGCDEVAPAEWGGDACAGGAVKSAGFAARAGGAARTSANAVQPSREILRAMARKVAL